MDVDSISLIFLINKNKKKMNISLLSENGTEVSKILIEFDTEIKGKETDFCLYLEDIINPFGGEIKLLSTINLSIEICLKMNAQDTVEFILDKISKINLKNIKHYWFKYYRINKNLIYLSVYKNIPQELCNELNKTIKDFNGEILSKMKIIETHQYNDPDYYYISFSDTIAKEYFIKTLDLMI